MAKFRNVSTDTRLVGVGVRRQLVEPDSVIDVPDDLFENYDQPGIWEPVPDGPSIIQRPEESEENQP